MSKHTTVFYFPDPFTYAGRVSISVDTAGRTVGDIIRELGSQNVFTEDTEFLYMVVDGNQVDSEYVVQEGESLSIRKALNGSDDTKNVLGLASTIAFGAFLGSGVLAGAGFGLLASSAIAVGGYLAINKIFRVTPRVQNSPDLERSPSYSFGGVGGGNRIRLDSPIPLLVGKNKIVPDLASIPYSISRGSDVYLNQIFTLGYNDVDLSDFRLGNDQLGNFQNIEIQVSDASGVITIVAGNVDSSAGAELRNNVPIIRSTSLGTIRFSVSISSGYFGATPEGDIVGGDYSVSVSYTKQNGGQKILLPVLYGTTPDSAQTTRISVESPELETGQYAVEVVFSFNGFNRNSRFGTTNIRKIEETASFDQLLSYQADTASYTGVRRIGMVVKATSQLNGTIDNFNCIVSAKTLVYNSVTRSWSTQATSNPGWWVLSFARGRFNNGVRVWGMGLPDSLIDIESMQAFAEWCDSERLTIDYIFDTAQSCEDLIATLASAGLGSVSWASGKLSVVWDAPNKLPSMLVTMGNILKGTFSASCQNESLGQLDLLRIKYIDPFKGWLPNVVDIPVPQKTTISQIRTLEPIGITNRELALKIGSRIVAGNVWRTIRYSWNMSQSGAVLRRGDVVYLSNELLLGVSGRLSNISEDGLSVQLDREVPSSGTGVGSIWISNPYQNWKKYATASIATKSDTLTLLEPLVRTERPSYTRYQKISAPLGYAGNGVVEGFNGRLFTTSTSQLYYSDDGGLSWIRTAYQAYKVFALGLTVIIIYSRSSYSLDNGVSFTQFQQNIGSGAMYSISIDGGTVYVSRSQNSSPGVDGVMVCRDLRTSPVFRQTSLTTGAFSIASNSSGVAVASRIYEPGYTATRVIYSTDFGASFRSMGISVGNDFFVAIDNNNAVVAMSNNAVTNIQFTKNILDLTLNPVLDIPNSAGLYENCIIRSVGLFAMPRRYITSPTNQPDQTLFVAYDDFETTVQYKYLEQENNVIPPTAISDTLSTTKGIVYFSTIDTDTNQWSLWRSVDDSPPIADYRYIFSGTATEPKRIKIDSIEVSDDGNVYAFEGVDDYPEYYAFNYSGSATDTRVPSDPRILKLDVRASGVRAGNSYVVSLVIKWDIIGSYGGADVYIQETNAQRYYLGFFDGTEARVSVSDNQVVNIQVIIYAPQGRRFAADSISYDKTVQLAIENGAPATVKGFVYNGQFFNWNSNLEFDLAGYRIKYQSYSEETNWDGAIPLHGGLITDSPWTPTIQPVGNLKYLMKAVDVVGMESDVPAISTYNRALSQDGFSVKNIDYKFFRFPGTIIGGEINAQGNLVSVETVAFWGVDTSLFWDSDSALFWNELYSSLVYTTPSIVQYAGFPEGALFYLDIGGSTSRRLLEYSYDGVVWVSVAGRIKIIPNSNTFLRVSFAPQSVQSIIDRMVGYFVFVEVVEVAQLIIPTASSQTYVLTKQFSSILSVQGSVSAGAGISVVIDQYNRIQCTLRIVSANGATVAGSCLLTIFGY